MRKYFLHIILNSAFLILNSFCFSQNAKIDSLKKVLLTAKEDTLKARLYVMLSEEWYFFNPDSSLSSCQKAFLLLTRQPVFIQQMKNVKGLEADALNNIGFICHNQGKIKEALRGYMESLKLREEINDKSGIASSLNNIAMIYKQQKHLKEAKDYWEKSLKIREELKDKDGLANTLSNIGYLYYQLGHIKEALECLNRSLKLYKEIKLGRSMAWVYLHIGEIYQTEGKTSLNSSLKTELFKKSLEYFNKALSIQEELNDKSGMAYSLSYIGNTQFFQKKFSEAYASCLNGEKMTVISKDVEARRIAALLLSKIDSARGNHKSAFEYYKKYIIYKDSISNKENNKKATQEQMQYEFDKKELQTKAEQDKKDAVTKIIIWSISAGLSLVLVFAGFIFRSFRQKQKANVIISQQKEEVEKQKQLVEMKQKEIIDSIIYAKKIQNALMPKASYIMNKINKFR